MKGIIMYEKMIALVRKYPRTTLALLGIATSVVVWKTTESAFRKEMLYQTNRAIETCGLEEPIIKNLIEHGPYYKGKP